MEAAARLLRPLKRGKPGKGGDTSPRRGLRNRPSRENSATSGSISTVEEGEVTSSRSVPNLNAGITRTSSLPGLPERLSVVSGEIDAAASSSVPSPLGDGSMSTDVSDSFKRAFQEMATERETLRKAVEEHKKQDAALVTLRAEHAKLNDSLDEARAQHKKELDRAVESSKTVSTLQADVQTLNNTITNKTREITALKAELATGDKKRVSELMAREKASDSAMLRKAREIETLKKQLETLKKRLTEAENDAVGFQKTSDRTAKTLQNLRDSLRAEEQKRISIETNLKKAQSDLLERRKEMSDISSKYLSAQDETARLGREVRALEKAAESAKGEGTDAASRISDLERQLSLRTDELKAAESSAERARKAADEYAAKLDTAENAIDSARSDLTAARADMTQRAKVSTAELSEKLEEAEKAAASVKRDLERERKGFATDLAAARETQEKEAAALADKANVMRENLANAKLAWGREKRDLAQLVENAQDTLLAKEREFRALGIKTEEAKANAEDTKWHLDRANKKLQDARDAAAQAEEESKKEVADLRARVSEVQTTFRAAEKRASVAELGADEAKVSLEQVKERLARATASVTEWKEKTAAGEKETAALREKLTASASANDALSAEMKGVQDSLKKASAEAEKANEQVSSSNKKLGACQDELKDVKSRFESASADLKSMETSMKQQEEELTGLRAQVAEMTAAQTDLSTKAERALELESNLQTATSEMTSLQEQMSNTESAAIKELQESVEEKESLLRKSAEDQTKLEKDLADVRKQFESLNEVVQSQTLDSSELSQKVTALLGDVEAKEKALADTKEDTEKMQKDIEELAGKLSASETKSTELASKMETSEKEKVGLEAETKEHRASLTAAKEQIEGLEAKILEAAEEAAARQKTLEEELEDSRKVCEEKSSQIEKAQTEIDNLDTKRKELETELEDLRTEINDISKDRDESTVASAEKFDELCEERDELQTELEDKKAEIERLTQECEDANEQALSIAKEMADTQQLADEAQTQSTQVEEELANELREVKWALNEETLRADNAEAAAQTLREQGRTIYTRIEEFGEEAEQRVLEAETELETAVQDIGVLQGRIAELNNEVTEAQEKERDLKRKYEDALSDKATMMMDKESAERRAEMSQSEIKFHSDRLRTLEGQNQGLSDDLDKAKVGLRDAEDKLLRIEARYGTEKERLKETQANLDRLRGFESKYNESELEKVRLLAKVDQAAAARARVEAERDQTERRMREREQEHTREKMELMAERASFAETARKARSDLEVQRDEIAHYRSAMSSTASGAQHGEGGGKNAIVVGGASAVLGGIGLFGLRVLAKTITQPKS